MIHVQHGIKNTPTKTFSHTHSYKNDASVLLKYRSLQSSLPNGKLELNLSKPALDKSRCARRRTLFILITQKTRWQRSDDYRSFCFVSKVEKLAGRTCRLVLVNRKKKKNILQWLKVYIRLGKTRIASLKIQVNTELRSEGFPGEVATSCWDTVLFTCSFAWVTSRSQVLRADCHSLHQIHIQIDTIGYCSIFN